MLGEESNRAPKTQKVAGLGFLCSRMTSTIKVLEAGTRAFFSSPGSHFPSPTWERKSCILLAPWHPSFRLSFLHPLIPSPSTARLPPAALESKTRIRKCQTVNSVLWPRSCLFLGEFHSLSGPFFPLLQHGELEDSTNDHVYTK